MEKPLPFKDKFDNTLKKSFPGILFYHDIVEMKGKINAFLFELEDEKSLNDIWEQVRNWIAVYYQNNLESDFERWNIYIIFVLQVPVSKGLKYKVENDQLSSRKIVVDSFENKLDEKTRKDLLSTYINIELSLPQTNNDQEKQLVKYTSDSKVFSIINTPVKGKKEKDHIESLYDNLLNKLADEDSKS